MPLSSAGHLADRPTEYSTQVPPSKDGHPTLTDLRRRQERSPSPYRNLPHESEGRSRRDKFETQEKSSPHRDNLTRNR